MLGVYIRADPPAGCQVHLEFDLDVANVRSRRAVVWLGSEGVGSWTLHHPKKIFYGTVLKASPPTGATPRGVALATHRVTPRTCKTHAGHLDSVRVLQVG